MHLAEERGIFLQAKLQGLDLGFKGRGAELLGLACSVHKRALCPCCLCDCMLKIDLGTAASQQPRCNKFRVCGWLHVMKVRL